MLCIILILASSMNTQDMQGEAANSTDEEFEDVQTDEESEREMDVQMEKESAITLIPGMHTAIIHSPCVLIVVYMCNKLPNYTSLIY